MRLGFIETKIQEIKIAVRVDGGPNIGMGHIQRCLVLGSQLKKNGTEILFISKKDETIKKKIKQEEFEVIALKDNIDLKEDLKNTINAIKTHRVNAVITDSYAVNEYYLTEIKKTVPLLVSIDDLAKISFPSDIVINQNVYAKELNYHSSTGRTKFLLGPKYTLLREEFSNLSKRKINEKVKNILITLGGSDSFNLTPKILKILDGVNHDFKITVAIGPFFKNIAEIEKTAKEINKKVELIYDSYEMSKIMLANDLAIAGGGTTLYELAATGTPALAFCLAENQLKNIKGMAEAGALINMGWGNNWTEKEFCAKIGEPFDNYILRKRLSKSGEKLVDNKGKYRAAKSILSNFKKTMRPVIK